jgi:D-alanyl-D-alanine dipeptidase
MLRTGRTNYRQIPIVRDARSKERCADIYTYGIAGVNHYWQPHNPPYYHSVPGAIEQLMLREGVIDRLRRVSERLEASGLELFVFDAWRPNAVQAYFYNEWFPEHLRKMFPGWTEDQISNEVGSYWAKPAASQKDVDPESPPPHATGAAVDLTIRFLKGDPLWMGTIFDDVTKTAHADALEGIPTSALSFSEREARDNRRLLYWVMEVEGLLVNPNEWWHYSVGDQLWSAMTNTLGSPQPPYYGGVNPLNIE